MTPQPGADLTNTTAENNQAEPVQDPMIEFLPKQFLTECLKRGVEVFQAEIAPLMTKPPLNSDLTLNEVSTIDFKDGKTFLNTFLGDYEDFVPYYKDGVSMDMVMPQNLRRLQSGRDILDIRDAPAPYISIEKRVITPDPNNGLSAETNFLEKKERIYISSKLLLMERYNPESYGRINPRAEELNRINAQRMRLPTCIQAFHSDVIQEHTQLSIMLQRTPKRTLEIFIIYPIKPQAIPGYESKFEDLSNMRKIAEIDQMPEAVDKYFSVIFPQGH